MLKKMVARRHQWPRGEGRHVDFGGAVQQGALCDMALLRKLSVGSPDTQQIGPGQSCPWWVGWANVHEEISA